MGVTALVLAAGLAVSVSVATPLSPLPLEPVPVVVKYEAQENLEMVIPDGGVVFPRPVWLEIEGPNGTVMYREVARFEPGYGAERWTKGSNRSDHVLLTTGLLGSVTSVVTGHPFPVAGRYRFRVHYDDAKTDVHGVSPWERLEVLEPTGEDDVLVMEGLRRGVPYGELRAAHPGSRYFAFDRLEEILSRVGSIREGRDPDTGVPVDLPRAELAAWQNARYGEVVRALEEEADRSESNEQEALSRARMLAASIGDSARVAALDAKLERKYPNWRSVPDLR